MSRELERIEELLKKLASAFGPSGFEDEVRNMVIKELEPYVDSIEIDSLGNIIACKEGEEKSRVMLDAHMDEIGLIVVNINKNGFIRSS